MQYSKPVDTLIEKDLTLSLDQCLKTYDEKGKVSNVPYANAKVGLMYVMLCTQPDIHFVVSLVSHYPSNLGSYISKPSRESYAIFMVQLTQSFVIIVGTQS